MLRESKYVLLCFLMQISMQAICNDSLKAGGRPVNIQLQYAGNYGLFSVGIGKSYKSNKINVHLLYGYLPKSIGEVTVHTFALKSSFNFIDVKISPKNSLNYYTGIAVLYGITRNTYIRYPDYFPDGYYLTNAIHASLYLGMQLHLELLNLKVKAISFLTELGTLDHQLWAALSTRYVTFKDIWNVSLGIAFTLK